MREFGWIGAGDIAWAHDLRRCGWRLLPGRPAGAALLVHRPALSGADWLRLLGAEPGDARGRMVLIGIGDPGERGRLLQLGFADVVTVGVTLEELAVRAERAAARCGLMPRRLDCGRLRLDLFARDGFAGGRPLGLHPREFALLWRLAETPGRAVGKEALLADVWRLGHVPETNSIAVHMSRLRAKLALAGLDGLIATVPGQGYRLDPARAVQAGPPVKVAAFDPPG